MLCLILRYPVEDKEDLIKRPCWCYFLSLFAALVLICLASLAVWIMLLSNAVRFQIQDAHLAQFNLEDNNNLNYNLSLNFSIKNSNGFIGIHYDRFQAIVYYMDQRLAAVSVSPFDQGHKKTKSLETVFRGQNLVLLGRRKFVEDREYGFYRIDVKVRIKCMVKLGPLDTWPMKPIIRCHLKVPLASSNLSGGFDFHPTDCNNVHL